MSSRLRKVEHIEVFDMEGAMVAEKKEDPFSYTYQKEYYYGNKKIREVSYDSRKKKVVFAKNQLESLKKRVDKMLNKGFCFVDDDSSVELVVSGGSTVHYQGENPKMFLNKVLEIRR